MIFDIGKSALVDLPLTTNWKCSRRIRAVSCESVIDVGGLLTTVNVSLRPEPSFVEDDFADERDSVGVPPIGARSRVSDATARSQLAHDRIQELKRGGIE